tara:strand:+ start:37 stop:2010 length:1974 start_codon:yes stop_codon:yes gene_type:complete
MATIVTRAGKGSPLTNTEVDANFTNLNTDKAELSGATFTGVVTVIDGSTSAPSITNAGDTNTGMYFDGADSVAFTAGGTTRGAFNSGGLQVVGALSATGVLTANAGVVVDNITIDGNEIDCSSGNLVLDGASEIHLDADSGIIRFRDDGGDIGMFRNESQDFTIRSMVSNKDMLFKGNDNGSTITMLSLDASQAGQATFNNGITDTFLTGSITPLIVRATNPTSTDKWGMYAQYRSASANGNGAGMTLGLYNASGAEAEYVYFGAIIEDNTAGSQDGAFIVAPVLNNARVERFRISSSGAATFTPASGETVVIARDSAGPYFGTSSNKSLRLITNNATRLTVSNSGNISTTPPAGNHFVINENGVDSDFRVESDSNANAFVIDAGASTVGINRAVDANVGLSVASTATSSSKYAFQATNASGATKFIVRSDGYSAFYKTGNAAGFQIGTGGGVTTTPDAGNHFVINEDGADVDFRVESNNNANALFIDGGTGLAKLSLGLTVARDTHLGGAIVTINSNNAQGLALGYGTGTNEFRRLYHHSTGLYFESSTNQAYLSASGAWTNASDVTLKKDIEDIDYGIETVKSLKPRKYKMKSDDEAQIGFIAQELVEQVPEIVGGKDGLLGVSYGQLTAVLTKAIQEQQTLIESLTARIAALEE